MADQKLTQLTENTVPLSTDIAYMVNDPAGSPLGQKVTYSNFGKGLLIENIPNAQRIGKGADVASANDITLGNDGNYYDITGTTQINTIATTNIQAGTTITLQFDASVTVAHNTAGTGASILLAGAANFSATANDTLVLVYDGTTYRETSRTAI